MRGRRRGRKARRMEGGEEVSKCSYCLPLLKQFPVVPHECGYSFKTKKMRGPDSPQTLGEGQGSKEERNYTSRSQSPVKIPCKGGLISFGQRIRSSRHFQLFATITPPPLVSGLKIRPNSKKAVTLGFGKILKSLYIYSFM